MTSRNKQHIIFDLDDTLYQEIDYLKSAYKEISSEIAIEINTSSLIIYEDMLQYFYNKKNVFEEILIQYNSSLKVSELINVYRNHKPDIHLSKDKIEVLNSLKNNNFNLGLLTDGRSFQQRNKIEALKLTNWFSEIIISQEFGSEKPNINNYKYFEDIFGEGNYYYIADNVIKDFVSPNKLNWTTICLQDNGLNIHRQNTSLVNKEYLAKYTINQLSELMNIISKQD
ncbi:HAD family hydrolase [Yeosuana sp. AK3]